MDNCILWFGYIDKDGYGKFKNTTAHRLSYEINIGSIPEGLEIDHLCKNRSCINPYHLRVVSSKENMQNSVYREQTHCKNGHLFDNKNTYVWRGLRHCRKCNLSIKRRNKI